MKKTGYEITCKTCGKSKYKSKWELLKSKSDRHYCSRACANKDTSKLPEESREKIRKFMTGKKLSLETINKCKKAAFGKSKPWIQGDKHPRWRGGLSEVYPLEFRRKSFKKYIKDFYGYICMYCGKTEKESSKEYNRVLGIHHMDHIKEHNYLKNCISLCCVCNSNETVNPEKFRKYLVDIVNDIIRASWKHED